MAKDYIEKRGAGYYVTGKRVSLDSIIYAYFDGYSAESIVDSFPSVSLEEVYGTIAFYLSNRVAIDNYLAEGEKEFDRLRDESRKKDPAFYERLRSILDGKRALKP
jgi:uncharacterized protein (DUF433 family)